MRHKATFLDLPNEILLIILEILHDDKKTLAAIASLSKRTRRLAYLVLYNTVSSSALSNISKIITIDGELPAASFIKNIEVDSYQFPYAYSDNYISDNLRLLFSNIDRNERTICRHVPFSKLRLRSYSLPLYAAIGQRVPSVLLHLNELDLRTPFPKDEIPLCVSLHIQLYSNTLTQLTIDFAGVTTRPDYNTISKLLQPLPHSTPRLQSLKLNLGISQLLRPTDLLQNVFDNDKFTFTFLKRFHFETTDEVIRLKTFLLRHPNIQALGYRLICSEILERPEHTVITDLTVRGILPNISEFTGSLVNALLLSNKDNIERPLKRLRVHCGYITSRGGILQRQLHSLKNADNVRELYLTSALRGNNLLDITTIVLACPQLTHFGCLLSTSQPTEKDMFNYISLTSPEAGTPSSYVCSRDPAKQSAYLVTAYSKEYFTIIMFSLWRTHFIPFEITNDNEDDTNYCGYPSLNQFSSSKTNPVHDAQSPLIDFHISMISHSNCWQLRGFFSQRLPGLRISYDLPTVLSPITCSLRIL
ncbi:hypothetical protein BDP27DRAFT_1424659 [Rhodocollybia butyracea]|uniref:F-box domain-containing protein n=1 Tax=Rhodocollybia butyracea TaxID=206335 RepID=A0A9P5PKJ1_9AGAR|nr:hypothetical protein BDP27DRAFT_1424659 [Rhodocollybia butyracea]